MSTKANAKFAEADVYLNRRAPDFFGMGPLNSTPPGRFRILHHALELIPASGERTEIWLKNFDPYRAADIGKQALHQVVSVTVIDESAEAEPITSIAEMPAQQAYRDPKIHALVTATLRSMDDPAMHVVDTLSGWKDTERRRVAADHELSSARLVYEQLLFGIHQPDIYTMIEDSARAIAEQGIVRAA